MWKIQETLESKKTKRCQQHTVIGSRWFREDEIVEIRGVEDLDWSFSCELSKLDLQKSHMACTKESNPSTYQSCLEGKFCKLPFQSTVNKSVVPLEIVYSDI